MTLDSLGLTWLMSLTAPLFTVFRIGITWRDIILIGGGLFLMGATGESVRRLTDSGCYNPAWSPDGKEILCATEAISDPGLRHSVRQLWRVDVATGRRRPARSGPRPSPLETCHFPPGPGKGTT